MYKPDDDLIEFLEIPENELSEFLTLDEEEFTKAIAALEATLPEIDEKLLQLTGITNDSPTIPSYVARQQDTPNTKTTPITIRIDSYVLAELKRKAKLSGTPYQTLINHILRAEIMKRTTD